MSGVRVVAGSARGRRLVAPDGADVRPTKDRVREATCNALGSLGVIEGARVLDLFAGSGALGIEALSRGAAAVTFVEPDRAARRAIVVNLDATGFSGADGVLVADSAAEGHLRVADDDSVDLVFADPPYRFDAWEDLFSSLDRVVAHGGVVVVESDRPVAPPLQWDVFRSKRYGSTVVTIFIRASTPRLPGAEP